MRRIITISLFIAFLISSATCGPLKTTPSTPGTFNKIKIIRTEGEKTKVRDVILQFADEAIIVEGEESELGIKLKIPYSNVTEAIYKKSKLPPEAMGPFAFISWFYKYKEHWLTIYYNTPENTEDFVILRLDKRNYQMVLDILEAKTGITVELQEVEIHEVK